MENELLENEGAVSATQPAMVDGGRIDVFGSDCGNKLKHDDDFYSQLFELKDYESPDTTENYFSGNAQGIVNTLRDLVEYTKSTDLYKQFGSAEVEEYEKIIDAINKHFPDNEPICVKKYTSGWKIIYNI